MDMPFDTHWKRLERWKVTAVDPSVLTTGDMEVGNYVRFEGTGVRTDTKSILIRIKIVGGVVSESVWAEECDHGSGPPEKAIVQHKHSSSLGKFTIIRSSRTMTEMAEVRCYLGDGPTGLAWTAVEQFPPG